MFYSKLRDNKMEEHLIVKLLTAGTKYVGIVYVLFVSSALRAAVPWPNAFYISSG